MVERAESAKKVKSGKSAERSVVNRESYPEGFPVTINGRTIQVMPKNPANGIDAP